jgi:hypothetical protein
MTTYLYQVVIDVPPDKEAEFSGVDATNNPEEFYDAIKSYAMRVAIGNDYDPQYLVREELYREY